MPCVAHRLIFEILRALPNCPTLACRKKIVYLHTITGKHPRLTPGAIFVQNSLLDFLHSVFFFPVLDKSALLC